MVDLINSINDIGAGTVTLCIGVVLSFLVSAISLKNKLLDLLDLKTGKSIRHEETRRRIHDLEEKVFELEKQINDAYEDVHDRQKRYHDQSITIRSEIKDSQKRLDEKFQHFAEKFDSFIDDQNEKTVAGFRSSLWRMHKDFVEQGYVTPDGLKTFIEMGKAYEKAGGNDIYHEKLKPEVESLEIRHPEGYVYDAQY